MNFLLWTLLGFAAWSGLIGVVYLLVKVFPVWVMYGTLGFLSSAMVGNVLRMEYQYMKRRRQLNATRPR
jgi:hypothetical protein